jgi:NAD dependent epimerase/dehydratase family enzyme/uncharacterized protein YndB with AHSA1/START domain
LLATTIAKLQKPPSVFLSGSAMGYYGNRGDEELTETSSAGTGFLSDICTQWEAASAPAAEAGIRTALLRTGIVLSPDGGALAKQLPLFRLGLGGRFGRGRQWQSWIAIDDHVRAMEHLLTTEVSGPVNLTAPNPVTNAEFTATLAHVMHRPALLPIPKFGPSLLLGSELAQSLLYDSSRVLPAALTASSFEWTLPTLDDALHHLLGADHEHHDHDHDHKDFEEPSVSDKTVSATRLVSAPAQKIFDLLADPAMHPVLDGSGTVKQPASDVPSRLTLGAEFGMSMKRGMPYRVKNTVTAFDEPHRIAWKHSGPAVWSYELEEVDGGTQVAESWSAGDGVLSKMFGVMGVPKQNLKSIQATLERLERYVTTGRT